MRNERLVNDEAPRVKKWLAAALQLCRDIKKAKPEAGTTYPPEDVIKALTAAPPQERETGAKILSLVKTLTLYVQGKPGTEKVEAIDPIVSGRDWDAALAAVRKAAQPFLDADRRARRRDKVAPNVEAAIAAKAIAKMSTADRLSGINPDEARAMLAMLASK